MSKIKLIVGLGNPGTEYAQTRHNAGFWLLDELAYKWQASFKQENKFHAEVAKASLSTGDIWLLKPQTFMNRSGISVAALALFYKIAPDEILVVHDELDIPPAAVKLKQGGSNGGHNGLKDIQAKLGTPNFWRLRLGIGHPGDKNLVVAYVLKKAPKTEQELIDTGINNALAIFPLLLKDDFAMATQELHSKK
ncbi:aminoacyl-tRNA hydrolase [Neisseria sp. Ec49-e6-T10]|uniref:aminoacyl-tRNA hydrolase n=1 Tax=Neisseria sp. Ec49-e6-T10 TaxID=3140744 RepID=UPI003EBB8706